MTKYKHKGSVTTHHFEKRKEPTRTIDWDAIGGLIVLFFIAASVLGSCTS